MVKSKQTRMKTSTLFNYVEQLVTRLQSHGQHRTAETYRSTLNSLRRFRQDQDLSLNEVDAPFLMDYQYYLKNSGSAEELDILDELSELIEDARETNDQAVRAELYMEAMEYILDLAIELPVYQRSVLYAYNSKVIKTASLPTDINPYSSPLDKSWEIEFAG